MGAIFAVMKLNSSPCGVHYREGVSAHPHCSLAKRDLEDPEGWVSLGGWSGGNLQNGVGGWGGDSREVRRKETINTRLMTSNTLTTQQKLMKLQTFAPGAFCTTGERSFGEKKQAVILLACK